ncbi:cell surface glycoprotein [Colletotrichum truncatum]|uniref:Cell surface glycoprotein n=1 Tax=Colletotrichum truncatum TaxID=5467 RepID=A0ACC3ZD01_COLTU|nr:cell surface glycoprotein [Colletotrichum truncatum]KAF6797945.1 cell surface glycoprotein [Colletotrichum truncatum]
MISKLFTLLGIAILPQLASAGPCNNNCGRQVIGTAVRDPPSWDLRSSLCADFVTTYVTVTSGPEPSAELQLPTVIDGRNVHGPRQVTPTPVITGKKPDYASACSDVAAYWSACQCFDGVKPTTITVTAPAVAATTPTSSASQPSCTKGIEFAHHVIEPTSTLCTNVLSNQNLRAKAYDLGSLLQGRVPSGVGLSQNLYYEQLNGNAPINYAGLRGPEGSTLECNILVHRGYIKVKVPGIYEFFFGGVQDVVLIWFGDKARSGGFRAGNSDFGGRDKDIKWPDQSFYLNVEDASEYIPFRVYWSNGEGAGAFGIQGFPAAWGDWPDEDPELPEFYSNCSGDRSPAPAWLPWESEDYSGGA